MDLAETNRRVIEQFRAGGPIEGMHRERLVLLTTTGAKSGMRRTTPMMFDRDGDRVIVVAANAGAEKTPGWYYNLVANPRVTVEVGDVTYEATATPLRGAERDRIWAEIKARFPFFAGYEAKVEREIPVVALTRNPARA